MDYISLLYYFSRLQPSVIHKVLYVMYHKHQGSAVTELTLYPTHGQDISKNPGCSKECFTSIL